MQSLCSIHFNDSRKRRTRGFETYYHSGASFDLANRIQQKLMTIPNSANGGIHTANFRCCGLRTVLRFSWNVGTEQPL